MTRQRNDLLSCFLSLISHGHLHKERWRRPSGSFLALRIATSKIKSIIGCRFINRIKDAAQIPVTGYRSITATTALADHNRVRGEGQSIILMAALSAPISVTQIIRHSVRAAHATEFGEVVIHR